MLYQNFMDRSAIPLLEHPLHLPSAFTPEALIEAVREERGLPASAIPPVCVLDFDGDLTDWLAANSAVRVCAEWACFHTTLFEFEVDGARCGIIPRTLGGPYAVLVAEQLACSGARVVCGLTSAGRISPALPIPSMVVVRRAIRDEGTSYHYLAPEHQAECRADVADTLLSELRQVALPLTSGLVWTTDAPYRETVAQLERHRDAGALAVEMQAASLFAFGAARQFPVGVVAHVTNAVGHNEEQFDKGDPHVSFEILKAICRAGTCLLTDSEPQNKKGAEGFPNAPSFTN